MIKYNFFLNAREKIARACSKRTLLPHTVQGGREERLRRRGVTENEQRKQTVKSIIYGVRTENRNKNEFSKNW